MVGGQQLHGAATSWTREQAARSATLQQITNNPGAAANRFLPLAVTTVPVPARSSRLAPPLTTAFVIGTCVFCQTSPPGWNPTVEAELGGPRTSLCSWRMPVSVLLKFAFFVALELSGAGANSSPLGAAAGFSGGCVSLLRKGTAGRQKAENCERAGRAGLEPASSSIHRKRVAGQAPRYPATLPPNSAPDGASRRGTLSLPSRSALGLSAGSVNRAAGGNCDGVFCDTDTTARARTHTHTPRICVRTHELFLTFPGPCLELQTFLHASAPSVTNPSNC